MIEIKRTDSSDSAFRELVKLLDADLAVRDGDDHAFYAQFNKIGLIKHAIVAFLDGKAVGCGAFKPFDTHIVEIKRMYTLPESRGMGIASGILRELEKWASELGNERCVLETGKNQPEAISLYKKNGYSIIPNYGQYENIENSVCFSKELTDHSSPSTYF